MNSRSLFPLRLLLLAGLTATVSAGPVKLTQLTDRVRVEVEGKLFTEYIFGDDAGRPYCHPVLSADGTALTRDFPMKHTPGEETDHPWHRSITFTHLDVNGIDFWSDENYQHRLAKPKGRAIQDEIVELRDGDEGVLTTRSRWVAADGRLICTDQRTLRFHASPAGRFIDFEITLRARPDQPLVFGDTKDGTMAVRVAQWLTPPHQYEGRDVAGRGHYLTSTGFRDADAWGKRAAWCDLSAPHRGKVYGIAFFDHPQNLRHPTWWMARDYGLFAANPFGRHDFEGRKDQPTMGNYTVPPGGTLTMRYRFYFHEGDPESADIAEHYADYVKS